MLKITASMEYEIKDRLNKYIQNSFKRFISSKQELKLIKDELWETPTHLLYNKYFSGFLDHFWEVSKKETKKESINYLYYLIYKDKCSFEIDEIFREVLAKGEEKDIDGFYRLLFR